MICLPRTVALEFGNYFTFEQKYQEKRKGRIPTEQQNASARLSAGRVPAPILHTDIAEVCSALDMATTTTTTTTTVLESLREGPHHEFFLPPRPRSRRTSSRRSSGGSEGSRASVSSTLSCSSTSSTDSGTSSDGLVKGLTILGVCLMYAFALFFIASLSTALSYIFRFGNKGTKTVVRKTVVCKSIEKQTLKKSIVRMPLHQQG